MNKGVITLAFILAVASLLIGIRVNIQETQKPVIQGQLADILSAQNKIDQKLAAIETKQQSIMDFFNTMGNAARNAGQAAQQPPRPSRPMLDPAQVYDIKADNTPIQGNKDAKVTIVEFSDLQCPYSQRFHPMVADAMKAYPNDVKYMLKNFPLSFHPKARPAAKAVLAAGAQGKYYEMAELLFKGGENLNEENYPNLAKELGLDVEKFKKDLKEKDAQWEKQIIEDMTLGGQINVQGTPSFFLNGKATSSRDAESLKAEIAEILKKK